MVKLSKNYPSPLTNTIIELLLAKEDRPYIEAIIEEEFQKVERLKKLKEAKNMDFGEELTNGRAEEVFHEVKSEVDYFLEVSGVNVNHRLHKPNIILIVKASITQEKSALGILLDFYDRYKTRHISFTNPLDYWEYVRLVMRGVSADHSEFFRQGVYRTDAKNIEINAGNSRQIANFVPVTAHEYAHALQGRNKKRFDLEYRALAEAQAEGVARHVSKIWAAREQNEAYLYSPTYANLAHLESAYLFICTIRGIKPNERIIRKMKNDIEEYSDKVRKREWDILSRHEAFYPLGSALFYILERRLGTEIVKRSFHGDYSFLTF